LAVTPLCIEAGSPEIYHIILKTRSDIFRENRDAPDQLDPACKILFAACDLDPAASQDRDQPWLTNMSIV
jgi:hypothetical protein